ncbi:MAG: M1 family metallopeptidase [Chloroflexi bacterium]|nr:M1 family metallopeptidase [Chloroflexota bacterium]
MNVKQIRLVFSALILLFTLTVSSCVTAPRPSGPQLFEGRWDDLGIYDAGLIEKERASKELLLGATVYHLDITIASDYLSLTGREQVRYTNRETVDLESLYFQLFPNVSGGKTTISAVQVDNKAADFANEPGDSALRVTLSEILKPQNAVTVQVDFTVDVPRTPSGNYGLFGYFNDILALDGFYPVVPVYDDVGWHIRPGPLYGDKTFLDASFYLVRVTAPASLVLVASGSEVRREKKGEEQFVTFAAGPARDFYLAGSSRFTSVNTRVGETTINSYAFTEQIAGANQALTFAAEALKSYNARLGDYPYTELDIVPLNLEAGAAGMEYPGVFGVDKDIYNRDVILEPTVAHEVGHQWFYNVVGNDQVNEPWLDESMTQYITGLYYLDRYGENGWQRMKQTWVSGWERAGRQMIPIGLPVASYRENQYGAIIYARGPLFIDALAGIVGEQKFDDCLRRYYESNKWQIVTTASFQEQFEACSASDLGALFKDWVLP